jgi:hypothetical protein
MTAINNTSQDPSYADKIDKIDVKDKVHLFCNCLDHFKRTPTPP